MDTTIDQQVARDEALGPHAKRLRIGRSNFRLLSDIKSKESTLQLVYDVLCLTPFFKAFLVTADVLEIYMQEFWATATVHHHSIRFKMDNKKHIDIKSKESTLQLVYDVLRMCPFFKAFLVTADVPEIYMQEFWATATVHHHAIRFKMDNKKHIVNLESFRDILHICPRVHGQSFAEPPFEEEILAFIRFLGHSAAIRTLIDVNINKLYQPWSSFAAIINKCLTEKSSGYDSLRLSQAQILLRLSQAQIMWGLYHKRNVDFAYLMWEDFVYQVEHKDTKKSNEMYYHWFTKVIIHHFMLKDPSILRRNKVNWHYVRDDHIFSTIKLVSSHQNTQQFGALLPIELTNKDIKNSNAYKEYYAVTTGVLIGEDFSRLFVDFEDFGSQIDGRDSIGADKGTGSIPWVPDVPNDESEEEISWNSTDEEGDDDEGKDGNGDDDDNGDDGKEGDGDDDQEVERDDENDDEEDERSDDEQASDEEEFIHLSLSTHTEEETREEESFDLILKTPENSDDEGNGEEDLDLNTLEANFSEFMQTNQFARAVSAIPKIVHRYMDQRMNEAVQVAVQLQSDRLREEAQKENDEFLKIIDENMQKIIKEHVKE
nr:hypothetical protein [Tanacetum cinerariifolium]